MRRYLVVLVSARNAAYAFVELDASSRLHATERASRSHPGPHWAVVQITDVSES